MAERHFALIAHVYHDRSGSANIPNVDKKYSYACWVEVKESADMADPVESYLVNSEIVYLDDLQPLILSEYKRQLKGALDPIPWWRPFSRMRANKRVSDKFLVKDDPFSQGFKNRYWWDPLFFQPTFQIDGVNWVLSFSKRLAEFTVKDAG